jgi:hypothetical protein
MVGVGAAAATGPAVIVPLTGIGAVAPVTFLAGIGEGFGVKVTLLVLAVVGVPPRITVITVLLVRTVDASTTPAGSPDTPKSATYGLAIYCPFDSVKIMLAPLTAFPT